MFIDELKDYIVAHTDLVFGTDLFIGKLPIRTISILLATNSGIRLRK